MVHLFIWWLLVLILGIIALPVTSVLFRNLPDRGYAFGKAFSILIVSYLLWLASWAHILPNSRWAIILIIVLFALVSAYIFIRRRRDIASFVAENRGVIITTEVLFLLAFVLYAVVRAYNPEIINTEKPMDFAFINAILRTEHFPVPDPWLSGYNLNNYHFGHLIIATLTKLSGISSSYTFNISLAMIFGLASIGIFSIVYNLVRLVKGSFRAALGFGLAAAGFLLIIGNLEGILELFYAHGWGSEGFWNWLGINGLDSPYQSGNWYPTQYWWWWRASRVIPPVGGIDTISEFPFFSFLLGDLHAHLMSLPFVLMVLAFCTNILASTEKLGFTWLKKNPLQFLIMIVCLGALGSIHSWDLPTYTFIFIAAMLMQAYVRRERTGGRWWKGWLALSILTLFGIFLLYLPYYLYFRSPVEGIVPWEGPDTRAVHYWIIWGLFLFIGVSFILTQVRSGLRAISRRSVIPISIAVLLPWIIWTIVILAIGGEVSVWGRLGNLAPLLVLLALILLIIVGKLRKAEAVDSSALLALLLFFTGLLLTVGCELFYVLDIFNSRFNTVFRLYYQSWTLFAVASAFGLYYLYRHWQVSITAAVLVKRIWWVVLVIIIIGSLIYPIAATWSRTNGFSASRTLNGLAFLEQYRPSEADAVKWLNSNVKGTPVIVEATGNDYTEYGRISQYTGLPTILGWEQHQWVWRGSSDYTLGRREEVDLIYLSDDINQIEALLGKYDVVYVYVGSLEKQKYGAEVGAEFSRFMDVAFENEDVTIYKVR